SGDRLRTGSNSFVLPVGVSVDPSTEPMSLVVEADHQLVYQVDIPAGGLVTHMGKTGAVFRALHGDAGIGAGSRLVMRQTGVSFRMRARFDHLDLSGFAGTPRFAKLLVKIGDDCFSAILACSTHGQDVSCAPERSARLRGAVAANGGGPLS